MIRKLEPSTSSKFLSPQGGAYFAHTYRLTYIHISVILYIRFLEANDQIDTQPYYPSYPFSQFSRPQT